MQELCTYHIKILGRFEDSSFTLTSPYQISDQRAVSGATFFTIYADQSGLVGLIRHLHHRGFVLLSVQRKE